MSIVDSTGNKSIVKKGFISLTLLAVFLALAVILPRILVSNISGGVATPLYTYGHIDVAIYSTRDSVNVTIRNNYSKSVNLIELKICNYTVSLNNTVLSPGSTVSFTLKNISKEVCISRLTYSVDNRLFNKLFTVNRVTDNTSFEYYEFSNYTSRSTYPHG